MNRKTLLAAALAAGSLMGMASVAQAEPAVVAGTTPYGSTPYYGNQPYYGGTPVYGYPGQTVMVQPAPPAPIYEAVPAPREGYIWAPGHYAWDNGRYAWRGGEWVASRPGYAWQAAHWQQRSDGSWYLVGGTWVGTDNYASYENQRGAWGDRDRDGDGVRNRDDRFPNDPYRN
jgi:hypothetical protein